MTSMGGVEMIHSDQLILGYSEWGKRHPMIAKRSSINNLAYHGICFMHREDVKKTLDFLHQVYDDMTKQWEEDQKHITVTDNEGNRSRLIDQKRS